MTREEIWAAIQEGSNTTVVKYYSRLYSEVPSAHMILNEADVKEFMNNISTPIEGTLTTERTRIIVDHLTDLWNDWSINHNLKIIDEYVVKASNAYREFCYSCIRKEYYRAELSNYYFTEYYNRYGVDGSWNEGISQFIDSKVRVIENKLGANTEDMTVELCNARKAIFENFFGESESTAVDSIVWLKEPAAFTFKEAVVEDAHEDSSEEAEEDEYEARVSKSDKFNEGMDSVDDEHTRVRRGDWNEKDEIEEQLIRYVKGTMQRSGQFNKKALDNFLRRSQVFEAILDKAVGATYLRLLQSNGMVTHTQVKQFCASAEFTNLVRSVAGEAARYMQFNGANKFSLFGQRHVNRDMNQVNQQFGYGYGIAPMQGYGQGYNQDYGRSTRQYPYVGGNGYGQY